MTDERIGDALLPTLERLPRGSGVIFRHYATAPAERRRLFETVRAVTRRRRITLLLAGTPREAIAWRADGAHGRSAQMRAARLLIRTAPAHGRREVIAARRAKADLILLSPVFATRSHPGGKSLGPIRFGLAIPGSGAIVALGGMNARRFQRLRAFGAYGWAAIDALAGPIRI